METVVTHHPFRTIELIYDRDKQSPAWEKETMENYFHMHDEVWRLKTMREEYEQRLDQVITDIAKLKADLHPIDQEIELLELATGLREENPLPGFEGSITVQLDNFRKAIKKHNKDLMALHALLTICVDEHNVFLEVYNAFEKWFEEYSDGKLSSVYQNYDDVSVDTVSLDRDHQAFLETWSPVIHAEYAYFERSSDAFEAYAELVKTSEALYRRSEKLDNSIDEFIKKNKKVRG